MIVDVDYRAIVPRSAMPDTDVVHAPSVVSIYRLGNCPGIDLPWIIGVFHDSPGSRDVAII
jgi:hypothetical protein